MLPSSICLLYQASNIHHMLEYNIAGQHVILACRSIATPLKKNSSLFSFTAAVDLNSRKTSCSIQEISSLSYGLDSEDEETLRRNSINFFSDAKSENFPNHVWTVLLLDALALRKVRSFFQAATIWCFFILFLALTSVSIIGPFNQNKLSQQEILKLGVEEKYLLNVIHDPEENKTSIELSKQDSRLASPSIIKFRKRKNFSTKEMLDPLSVPRDYENEERISKRLMTDTATDITSKLVDLENLIHKIGVEIGRLQNDVTPENKVPEDKKIRKIVHEEIIEVEKEKLGLPDFALESSGGNVIGTPNTKTYASRTLVQLFGFPLWYVESSPRNAIQASVSPGECWSFHGHEGNLRVQLAAPAILYGFSIYHIPQQISLSGDITSCPREFSVVGFHVFEGETSELLLGEYVYDNNGSPQQTFLIQREVSIPFSIVELRIHSNYGHPEFTCLYRFQVHGRFSVE
ncbi:nuclear migration and anchoring protein unc-84-like isoform X3 [Ischnura elegans]|uniref:nuclear migration and anchoring protein unc-84-like isoform X3 n=1 Tax=Ischnura elegans TaxID=197161 RepID=UPI001ED8788D|nr:nuclear migration and anchoring protein unc-84-like isoform X3 [Ischnura elegans]